MSNNNINLLGWGIVGTSKGRQRSSMGVDQQINQAGLFDLPQEIGACFPDVRNDDFRKYSLYYLTYRDLQQYKLMGFAQYYPILEAGQSRPGSYFGSFIETVNSCFHVEQKNLQVLLSSVQKLNTYQFKNFIDHSQLCYKQSIQGVHFDPPVEELNKISENLIPLPENLLDGISQQDTLFIYFEEKTDPRVVLELLLKQNIYYQYKNIYFSNSNYIANKIQEKKNIVVIQARDLFINQCIIPQYKEKIIALTSNLIQYKNKITQLNNDIRSLNENREHEIIKAVEQRTFEEKEKLKKDKEELFIREQKLKGNELSSELGKIVLSEIYDRKEILSNLGMEYLIPVEKKTSLDDIKRLIQGINRPVNQQSVISKSQIIEKESIYTWIFAGLSFIFLMVIAFLLIWDNDNKKEVPLLNNIKNIETKIEDMNNKIENVNKKQEIIEEMKIKQDEIAQ